MTPDVLTNILDHFLIKFFVIAFAFIIVWYFIQRISYGGK